MGKTRARVGVATAIAVVVFVGTVRCGRDAHIAITEQNVPNPIAHPVLNRNAGTGDGFGPVAPSTPDSGAARPAMPAIQPPPPAPYVVPVPPLRVPALPGPGSRPLTGEIAITVRTDANTMEQRYTGDNIGECAVIRGNQGQAPLVLVRAQGDGPVRALDLRVFAETGGAVVAFDGAGRTLFSRLGDVAYHANHAVAVELGGATPKRFANGLGGAASHCEASFGETMGNSGMELRGTFQCTELGRIGGERVAVSGAIRCPLRRSVHYPWFPIEADAGN